MEKETPYKTVSPTQPSLIPKKKNKAKLRKEEPRAFPALGRLLLQDEEPEDTLKRQRKRWETTQQLLPVVTRVEESVTLAEIPRSATILAERSPTEGRIIKSSKPMRELFS